MARSTQQERIIELLDSGADDASPSIPTVQPRVFRIVIDGQPKPQERPRFHNGGLGFPSRKWKLHMKSLCKAATSNKVIFGPKVPVSVTIWFYRKRPQTDFVGRRRQPGNLRHQALSMDVCSVDTADLDNLGKMVLDALSGVVYSDDKQVANLHLHKRRDNQGACLGRTVVEVTSAINS